MDDSRKTKLQLMSELNELRERVAGLEAAVATHRQIAAQRDELFARLQLALDSMPLGCIIVDPDKRIVYWNAATSRRSSVTPGPKHWEI
jgi:PAS domain-containing protein